MSTTNLNLQSAGVTNALRDIKPPVEIPSGWALAVWAVGALALAALLYWAWKYWQRQRALVPAVPIIPPHVRAKQKLEEALALLGDPKAFCIAVSDTIRWYLEERFNFHAPERTTEEFLYELQETDLLMPDQKESLGEFLKRCDLVKFAKYEPREPELRELHSAALRLVEETEPVAQPPGDASGGGSQGVGTSPVQPVTAESSGHEELQKPMVSRKIRSAANFRCANSPHPSLLPEGEGESPAGLPQTCDPAFQRDWRQFPLSLREKAGVRGIQRLHHQVLEFWYWLP
jgi:hypothetical protein